ncbi:hypothetical protein DFA_10183 [Cavenderia fasciculata]|uniref:BLOC-2 complex member HPS3 C-terminal domain-containing protein n=1 Tax=Cavenderia fasciculata TaxID=261658 RepID=F4Q9I0_CACFS|nr:uncharacterized protein DFA_10183 [Cavenderia fasciculata]EGG15349.1 hypothetical protein DFA_10183 [Cavenderia fasciculata]|eukprot:XP_004354091.1 hypothetical protein DFA_10183 [Cavenderia fasciculata]
MVKFLLFPVFDSQNLVPQEYEDEPIDVIPALNDFLMSTKGGEIIHYTIGAASGATIINKFSTKNSSILALHYITASDSILTLEKDTDISKINVVRIYQNWRQNQNYSAVTSFDQMLSSSPSQMGTTPQGGGGVGGGGSSAGSGHGANSPLHHQQPSTLPLHVYKIPVPSSVTTINVCPVTSRVIVATEKSVSVWGNTNITTSSSNLLNSFERILDIDADNVRHVAIYEGYLAYSTSTNVKILSLNIQFNDINDQFNTAHIVNHSYSAAVNNGPSEIMEDEHYFEVCFDSMGNPTGKNQLSCLQTTFSNSTRMNEDQEYEIIGPITDIDHGINVNSESGYSLLSSTLVLNRKFSQDDDLHSLFFLPDLPKSTESGNNNGNNTQNQSSATPTHQKTFVQINQHYNNNIKTIHNNGNGNGNGNNHNNNEKNNNNISMRCVVSTQKQGFLYNITKPSLLASYLYANETLLCAASHCFLYTMTTEGLQTWTLRSCEAPEDGNVDPPPIGLGLNTFGCLSKMAVIGDHLLLLSKFTHDINEKTSLLKLPSIMRSPSRMASPAKKPVETGWSIYILHHTPLQTLYGDILEYANQSQDKDEEVYHQLLLEGHFLLQSKLANQHQSNTNMNDVASIINHGVERNIYRSLLKQSSSYLGDYFLKTQQDYMRAAVWYSTSNTDIELVFNLLSQNPESHKALSYYLKQVLFNPSSVELLANKEELNNKILKHYHSESPHNLSVLILESSVSSYSQVLAIDLLKDLSEKCDFDMEQRNMNYFALGLLYLDQNNIDESMNSLNQIPLDSLIALNLKNPKLLAPIGDADPSALGKILRQTIPWGLLEIVVQLVKGKEITPDEGFTILLHSTETFAKGILNSNSNSYHLPDFDLDALLLKIYLEWFLTWYCKDININMGMNSSTASSISSILELVPSFVKYLIHLYVQDIQRFRGDDKQLFQSLDIDVGMIVNQSTIKSKNQPSQLNKKIVTDDYCNHWILFHVHTYTMIPPWLSKLPPFSADAFRNPSERGDPANQLTSLYHRKIHSVLSSARVRDFEFMDNIEAMFTAANDTNNIIFIELKLACLPLLDRMSEAIELVVSRHVEVVLEYGLHYCKQSDWAIVLELILKLLSTNQNNNNNISSNGDTLSSSSSTSQSNSSIVFQKQPINLQKQSKDSIVGEYERVLDYLTGFMDTESFLQLLPTNGKIEYFLPFIEKSFSNHYSRQLKSKLCDHLSNNNF